MAANRTAAPVFELRGATKRYGRIEALVDVDLSVHPGERVALVGASGAGKSTLLGLLSGTVVPSAGSVRVFGREPDRLSGAQRRRLRQRIGTVYQQLHLVDQLRVIHNVNAGNLGRWSTLRAVLSLLHPMEVGRAAAWLRRVGIADKLMARTDRLSGGERQRVALARVLVQDPDVILADEPIAHLDPARSRTVMDLLRELNEENGKTEVFSLHDVDYAYSHCERIVGLHEGRVVFDEPAEDLARERVEALYRDES